MHSYIITHTTSYLAFSSTYTHTDIIYAQITDRPLKKNKYTFHYEMCKNYEQKVISLQEDFIKTVRVGIVQYVNFENYNFN